MCGDGSTASCRRHFRFGSYYTTGNLTGSAETYHEIYIDSILMGDQGASVLRWQFMPVTNEAKAKVNIKEVKYASVDL
eukprot:IDg1378t1